MTKCHHFVGSLIALTLLAIDAQAEPPQGNLTIEPVTPSWFTPLDLGWRFRQSIGFSRRTTARAQIKATG